MLTRLDETLRHQLPTTFDHAGTSDPRFYDRYFFGLADPRAQAVVHLGIATYLNMNVMDGYVALQRPRPDAGTEQHNLRLSRALRPDIDTVAVGPLSVEILEPYAHARVRCEESDVPIALDVEWRATSPPKEEDHHFRRLRGRVTTDYHRYTQIGRADGWIEHEGARIEVDGWFAARDHSWGVREQVAGPEPVTGPPGWGTESFGFVFCWLPFQCGELTGHVQLQALGDGTVVYRDGALFRPDGTVDALTDLELHATFFPGTRQFQRLDMVWSTAGGAHHDVQVEPLLRAFSMDGTGYDWGWQDGLGLGVYRGEAYAEHDVYDLSDPEAVVRPDGTVRRPMHREAPSRVLVDGEAGLGHEVFVVTGPVPWLGLD